MNSIYDKECIETFISRINKLTTESKPLWGKMSVDQMVLHCKLASDVAFGTSHLKSNFLMQLLGKFLKKKVLYGGEMAKNSPTAKEFMITEHHDLEIAKKELIENVSRFANEGESSIKLMVHPFWGKMSYEDWDALMWKHLDHHLKQFGV
jgi:hypothetical protein